jgi:beta-xylosidase
VIEAAMIWNEPNNKSHWDPNLDPDWSKFGRMINLAGRAIRAENAHLPRIVGGMSPIDPSFVNLLAGYGVMDNVDGLAVHGFPLDWNLWQIHDWPAKIDEIRAVTTKPVWVSEVGISTFGAEEVQVWGLRRTAELLVGKAPRIHWYSLYDLPKAWEATTRHKEAEGSSYYRTSTWGFCARTAPRSQRRRSSLSSHPISGFASGSTSRTIAWTKRSPG